MSRLISLLVGAYIGVVVDQNFKVPTAAPQQLVDAIKGVMGGENKKK